MSAFTYCIATAFSSNIIYSVEPPLYKYALIGMFVYDIIAMFCTSLLYLFYQPLFIDRIHSFVCLLTNITINIYIIRFCYSIKIVGIYRMFCIIPVRPVFYIIIFCMCIIDVQQIL